MVFLYVLVSLFVIWLFLSVLEGVICKRNDFIIYIGIPGSGKSTIAALIARKVLKKKKRAVYSNFAIKGTYEFSIKDDLGYYDISNSVLILDELGVDLDNRNWKNNFTQDQVYFIKHHRHYNVDIYGFSQSFDMDSKMRNLAREYRIVYKSFIPFFVVSRSIGRKIDINKDTGEIIDRYYWKFMSRKFYFMPKSWKLFNSYSKRLLPSKHFNTY